MIISNIKHRRIGGREILIHSFIGLLIGYFILHPISMVIHWFELNDSFISWSILAQMFSENILHSFSLHMMPMSVAFAILGLLGGLGSGFYYHSIKEKESNLQGKRQLLKQSIPTLIKNGENEYVEFKSSLRYDYRNVKTDKNLEHIILKSIAGFLNAKGGILILGVHESREILGLANDYWTLQKKNKHGFQQRIILLVSNAFGKAICSKIHISFHETGQKEICTLFIEPSSRPIYFNEENRTIFFLRTGNVTNPLTTSETVKYLQDKNSI